MSIVASHICKTYANFTALEDVNVQFENGKLIALLGPSGSGKTTLLRILAGLEIPDAHPRLSIKFDDREVTQVKPGDRGVGFVFQHYALFKNMTVRQNIAFGLNVRPSRSRPSKNDIRDKVEKLLAQVQMESFGGRFPHQLSGGQRQRVALARALAIDPKVLLLDEPFGALDAKVRKDLRRWLRKFHEEAGISTIFVTHDQEEALELADEIVILHRGRIEQTGKPQEIYDHPGTEFVCEFLGNVNRLHPQGKNTSSLYIRPHEVEVMFATEQGTHAIARVSHLFAAGPVARVNLHLTDGQFVDAEIPRSQLEAMALGVGDEVGVRFRNTRRFGEINQTV